MLLTVMLLLARKDRPRGELTGWVLTLYAVFRIAVEFVREPDVQIGFLFGGVTMGQLLSIPVLIAGVWLLVRSRGRGAQKVYLDDSSAGGSSGDVPPDDRG